MSRIDISKAESGIQKQPFLVLVYGPEGVGKSTLAAGAPSPIVFDPTGGTDRINITRIPRPDDGFTWTDLFDVVEQLSSTKHGFTTLVLDELGELERMCWAHICRRDNEPDISGKTKSSKYAYARGYDVALDEWRRLLQALEGLRRARRMNVILLGHSNIRTFANPEGEDFDRYELKLHKKLAGLLKEWVEAVLFCRFEVLVDEDGDRARGAATGARLLHTAHSAAYDAKNRYSLPERMPLDWDELSAAMEAGAPASAAGLLAELSEIRGRLAADVAKQLDGSIRRVAGDANKLAQLVNWARGKVAA